MNSSRLSCRQSVTTKSGCRTRVAAAAIARRLARVGDRELEQVDRRLAPHQALDQRAVEQHPAAVELGEAGREGAGDAHALVVEARPPLLEAEGDQAQDVAGLAPSRSARSLPRTPEGMPSAVGRSCSGVAVSWPPPASTPRSTTSSPCGTAGAAERPLPVGHQADPPHPGDGEQPRLPAARELPVSPPHGIGDHRGVAAHQLALEVLAVAGHQRHGDDHRRHPEPGRQERRARRAVEQPAAPPAQEAPGDHPGEGAGEGRVGGGAQAASRFAGPLARRGGEEAVEEDEASCGPGAASGWYCTDHTGLSVTANPSTVPSFRLTWVDRAGGGSARDRRRSRGSGW